MKTNRRRERIKAVQVLYGWEQNPSSLNFLWSFDNRDDQAYPYARVLVDGVIQNVVQIDTLIKKNLIHWNFERLHRIDLAILRVAVYTLLFVPDIAAAIIIDEAIEIAKLYSDEEAPAFINGVLDAVAKASTAHDQA